MNGKEILKWSLQHNCFLVHVAYSKSWDKRPSCCWWRSMHWSLIARKSFYRKVGWNFPPAAVTPLSLFFKKKNKLSKLKKKKWSLIEWNNVCTTWTFLTLDLNMIIEGPGQLVGIKARLPWWVSVISNFKRWRLLNINCYWKLTDICHSQSWWLMAVRLLVVPQAVHEHVILLFKCVRL